MATKSDLLAMAIVTFCSLAEPLITLAEQDQLLVHEGLNPWNDDWERGMLPDIDFHNMGKVMHG